MIKKTFFYSITFLLIITKTAIGQELLLEEKLIPESQQLLINKTFSLLNISSNLKKRPIVTEGMNIGGNLNRKTDEKPIKYHNNSKKEINFRY